MSALGMAPAQQSDTGTHATRGPQPHGFLLVVSGPSGAGKGTLVSYLIEHRPDCVFSVSATTRPRRSTEAEGREYMFLTRDEFERRRAAGYFLETAEVHGNLYGTPVEMVDSRVRAGRVVVLDVDVQGGASVRRVRPDAVSVFVYPPSLDSLRARLAARATDSPQVIDQRIANAPAELAQWVHYDYVVMNEQLERAQAQLVAIHDAEHVRVHRLRVS
jgi:guanylate kinase